jgi:hypothetical protein
MLVVKPERTGSSQTFAEEFLEVWFVGAHKCVTVTKAGWCGSTAGPRPRGDAYAGDDRTLCYRFESVKLAAAFEVKDVWVPLPPSGAPTALCVNVVHKEYINPEEASKKGRTVYRLKAFATLASPSAKEVELVGTYDVPLVLRPVRLVPVEGVQQRWEWRKQLGDYDAHEDWCRDGITLSRGTASLENPPPTLNWSAPPSSHDLYAAYKKYRETLETWTRSANWSEFGKRAGGTESNLPRRMSEVPTWFPSRLAPHVPGLMAADVTCAPFKATPAWWDAQLRMVLKRAGVTEDAFRSWKPNEKRTACVAMRVAKLWASSRMYVTDWMTVDCGGKQGYVENDAYLDLRVVGAGDCDDYALCVYRAFSELRTLSEKDFSESVALCAAAASNYHPFLCTGLYHDAPLCEKPSKDDDVRVAPTFVEHPHAFVVALPVDWVGFWTSKGEKAPATKPFFLLGDGTCWTDPCMDGGSACEREGFTHVCDNITEARARFVKAVSETQASDEVKDAIGITFVESVAKAEKDGVFHMHDAVVTLAGFGVITKEEPEMFQFRTRSANTAAGLLGDAAAMPLTLRLDKIPPPPPHHLKLFRDALKYERPVPVLRTSPEKREAMTALAEDFKRRMNVPEGGEKLQAAVFAVSVSTESCVARYPHIHVANEKAWNDLAESLGKVCRAANLSLASVEAHAGTELWLVFAV